MSDEKNNRPPDEVGQRSQWEVVAETTDRTQAEFAVSGLKAYDIPAVIDSRAGVFGSAGLKMHAIYSGRLEKFKILVPADRADEARDLVPQFISDGSPDDAESAADRDEDND